VPHWLNSYEQTSGEQLLVLGEARKGIFSKDINTLNKATAHQWEIESRTDQAAQALVDLNKELAESISLCESDIR
jgi:hypothetical protein